MSDNHRLCGMIVTRTSSGQYVAMKTESRLSYRCYFRCKGLKRCLSSLAECSELNLRPMAYGLGSDV